MANLLIFDNPTPSGYSMSHSIKSYLSCVPCEITLTVFKTFGAISIPLLKINTYVVRLYKWRVI